MRKSLLSLLPSSKEVITRFAPSPTGPLHLGHAYSARRAFDAAVEAGGTFLLRIDDIDRARARPEWENLIFEEAKRMEAGAFARNGKTRIAGSFPSEAWLRTANPVVRDLLARRMH